MDEKLLCSLEDVIGLLGEFYREVRRWDGPEEDLYRAEVHLQSARCHASTAMDFLLRAKEKSLKGLQNG